ncbi:MAG: cytochrome c biogenesis protein CcdA [Saprospiraceae bacterium]
MIALLGGIITTGVCPCTLPVGLGIAGLASSNTKDSSNTGMMIALGFFVGIVACLGFLGALAGSLGIFLTETFGQYWALSMAVISLMAAVIAFYGPRMGVDKLAAIRRPGMGGAFVYGLIFSLGTSAAPLLLLLSVAAAIANPMLGFILALFFGIGRGLPFLIVGVFAGAVTKLAQLTWFRKSIQIASGLALLFVSYYYIRVFINLQ